MQSLKPGRDKDGSRDPVVMALVGVGAALVIPIFLFSANALDGMDWFCYGFAWVATVVAFVWAVRSFWTWFRSAVETTSLSVSNASPQAGEEFSYQLQLNFKRPVDQYSCRLELVFQETAQQGSDSSVKAVRHERVVQQVTHSGRSAGAGDSGTFSGRLQIPGDAMHSFESSHNQLSWEVRLQFDRLTESYRDKYHGFTVRPQGSAA